MGIEGNIIHTSPKISVPSTNNRHRTKTHLINTNIGQEVKRTLGNIHRI